MKSVLNLRTFTVAKQGNTDAENEDRHFVRAKRNLVLALSDGATESVMSGAWAEALVTSGWKNWLLTDVGCSGDPVPPTRVSDWLEPLRERFWADNVHPNAPWYLREKLRRGAAATLLAFRMNPQGHWRAVSLGDTCVLTVMGVNVVESAPLRHANQFDNQPELISSRPGSSIPTLTVHKGHIPNHDAVLVFATDALASWMLTGNEAPARIRHLLECKDSEEFAVLVSQERQQKTMKNDDTTALVIQR